MFSFDPTFASVPSHPLAPIAARVQYDNSIRNCFGHLSEGRQNSREEFTSSSVPGTSYFFWVRAHRPDGGPDDYSPIIMQISFADKRRSAVSSSTPFLILTLNGLFANANNLNDGETVILHPSHGDAIRRCESVVIRPRGFDDWEEIMSSVGQVEELFLGQHRVIQAKMRFCLHLNNGKVANFTVEDSLPQTPMSVCYENGTSSPRPAAFLMAVGTRVLVAAPNSDGKFGGNERDGQAESKEGKMPALEEVPFPVDSIPFDGFHLSVYPLRFLRVLPLPIGDFLPFPLPSSSNPFFAAHRRLCLLLNTLPFLFVMAKRKYRRRREASHQIRKCCVQLDDRDSLGQRETPFHSFCDGLSVLLERFHQSSGLHHCWISPALGRLCRRSVDFQWIRICPIRPDQLQPVHHLILYPIDRAHPLEEIKETFLELAASSREFLTKAETTAEAGKRVFVRLTDGAEERNGNANHRITHRFLWPLSSKMTFEFRENREICDQPTNECFSEEFEKAEETPTQSFRECGQMVEFPVQQILVASLELSVRSFLRRRLLPSAVNKKVCAVEAATPMALLLEGPCGSGKSTLLALLANKLRIAADEFVPIAIEIVDCSSEGNLRRFVESVDSVMAKLVLRWPSALFLDNFDTFVEKIAIEGDNYSSPAQNEIPAMRLIYQKVFSTLFGESQRRKVPIICAICNGSKVPEDILVWEGQRLNSERHRIRPFDKNTQMKVLNKLMGRNDDALETTPDAESVNFETIGELCRLVETFELRTAANQRDDTTMLSKDILSAASICKRHEFGEGELSIRFDQIAGLESVKRKLVEIFLWPARYPTLFALSGVRVGHRAILHGPTGCGKSMLTRALAGEMGANVFSVRGPQLLSKYIGQSEQNIRQLFAKAKASKPALIVFDEIDAIAPQRGSDNAHVMDRMVNQLLTELDGFEGDTEGIFVIAVTNRIDLVDKALLRPGRFDFKLYVELPDFELRLAILRLYCTAKWGTYLSDNVNLKLIAQQAEGCSGAEMRAIVQNALNEADREFNQIEKLESDKPRKSIMEVIDPRNTLLTNQEVLQLLNQAKGRHVPTQDSQNHNTIMYEALKYLNDTPASAQSRGDIISMVKALKKFKLTGAEIIQISGLQKSKVGLNVGISTYAIMNNKLVLNNFLAICRALLPRKSSNLLKNKIGFASTSSDERFISGGAIVSTSSNVSKSLITHKPTREEIAQRVKRLLIGLNTSKDWPTIGFVGEELKEHLLNYPASRMVVIEDGIAIKNIKKWAKRSSDKDIQGVMQQCLALCGIVSETKNSSGICVLTIDGGGTRGIMGLEILSELEKAAGKKIPELFDLIVGVSTGSIIATLIGAKGLSVEEAKKAYVLHCSEVFKGSTFDKVWSLGGRFASLSDNTMAWTNILKETLNGDFSMIDSARDPKTPRVAIVSLITNTLQLIPFVFRNYEHPSYDSPYRGSAKYKFWEAIRASSAAPSYFEEFKLDGFMHQDGGILLNNPTSIALQEAKQLWPHKNFHCIVSVGNGKFLPEIDPKIDERRDVTLSTPYQLGAWFPWLSKHYNTIMESATETELFHHCIASLTPPGHYFRLNPYMSQPEGRGALCSAQSSENKSSSQTTQQIVDFQFIWLETVAAMG
uniref:Peroxisomal ATPase PEX1 n=1 Tax=Globodera rostochiensis TaxID=31243 RepID=A0A914H336_GLORO